MKAKKMSTARVATKSQKTKKTIAVKSAPKAKKPTAKRVVRKAARRSGAETKKLQKTVLKGLRSGKSATALAEELAISRTYVYTLRNKG